MKIKFCGADREVTGSSHLITLDNGYKILLDCGLYQGYNKEMEHFNKSFYFEPTDIDIVILSHAHIDHSGRLPRLVNKGFDGEIVCTHATRSLCALMLLDSAKIQERDAEYYNKRLAKSKKKGKKRKPLYNSEDVNDTMNLFTGISYNKWFRIHENVEILLRDAGHILGSASVTLRINENGKTTMVGFTGDIGRPNRPILRDPKQMPEVDYLICESTYGAKDHIGRPGEEEKLLEVIKETCVENKGKLIIPAFSVGRTQEIVYMMDQMFTKGILPKVPVYVDSPLAVNATVVFGSHPECFDNELNEYLLIDDDPFGFNTLTYVRSVDASKALNFSDDPCIIISSSGMMNAGRVKHHLYNNIEKSKNTFLIVGYCSQGTPGGKLRDGADSIKLYGETKQVLAKIEVLDSFSAHADRGEIIDFIKNQRKPLKKLFLVHGNYDAQQKFEVTLSENGFDDVMIPKLAQEYVINTK